MDKSAPPDYIDLMLCRLYHCRPSELDEEDYERIVRHIICWNQEHQTRGETKMNG